MLEHGPSREELLADALDDQARDIQEALGEPVADEDVRLRGDMLRVAGRLQGMAIGLRAQARPRPPVLRGTGDDG